MGKLTVLAKIIEAKIVEAAISEKLHVVAEKGLKHSITGLQMLQSKLTKKEE